MRDSQKIVSLITEWMETYTLRSFSAMGRFVKASNLSMPQLSLLMRLSYAGPCEVNEIGTQFAVTSAAASQLVDRLVLGGFVERLESPGDRRVRQIVLTESGRRLVERSVEERNAWVADLVATLGRQDRETVLALLPPLISAEKRLPRNKHGKEIPLQ